MNKQWAVIQEEVWIHCVPLDDLVLHEAVDCVCGPRWEEIGGLEDEVMYMLVHHSLDGREKLE